MECMYVIPTAWEKKVLSMKRVVLVFFVWFCFIVGLSGTVEGAVRGEGEVWHDVGAEVKDTLYEGVEEPVLFRFVPSRLMFYSPYRGNEEAIRQVYALLDRYREDIEAGHAVVRVMGFCHSFGSVRANLAAAKNRTNQVKSHFILHAGMKEAYYKTSNSTRPYRGMTDIVALVGIEYLPGRGAVAPVVRDSVPVEAREVAAGGVEGVKPVLPELAGMPRRLPVAVAAEAGQEPRERVGNRWAMKTNLLYDVVGAFSLEFERRLREPWSVNLEGVLAWYKNDGNHRYYQLAWVSPEVRYWFKAEEPWHGHYGGVFGGVGLYDLENRAKGHKGEFWMAGVSYGYMFPIGRKWSLEAGIGVGYLRTGYEDYLPIDGHYVYQESKRSNYFGPLKAKLALVWRLDALTGKGGGR